MKRFIEERRAEALERLRAKQFINSRAKRIGSLTEEEWNAVKADEITRLEELVNGRKTS